MIKVIAFDYADVIALGPMSKWVRENLVPGEPRWVKYKAHTPKWDRGEMTLNEVYDLIAEITGMETHKVWDNFFENLEPEPEVIKIIKKLRENYKVFLFSNFHYDLMHKLLDKQGIKNLFDELIISAEHKFLKPEPEFYNILIKKSGVSPSEILFTDDRIINIEGAQGMGINTIHFKGAEDLRKEMLKFDLKV